MPIGIIANALAIAIGGFLGSIFGKHLPERIRVNLPFIFGLSSMAVGISMITKMQSLPGVILAVVLGTIIGEWIDLEQLLSRFTAKLKVFAEKFTRQNSTEDDLYIQKYVSLIVMFCTGATGILGSMTEAMTGDHSIMFVKAVLDFFTSGVFAASLGFLVSGICIPQFLFFMLLYFLSGLILPFTTPDMLGNFMACGGIIALATGIRLCEMKHIRISNMLPALLLIMPITWIWSLIF